MFSFLVFLAYKTTIILIDGKKVKLHIWDTSGQGRFCTIIRYGRETERPTGYRQGFGFVPYSFYTVPDQDSAI
jgi:GTPase SAR1 family protein